MNNERIYNQLIERAKIAGRRKRNGVYYEQHHIIPRCLHGSNEKCNLVLLTAREHFLAHWLLTKIHKNDFRLMYALNQLWRNNKGLRGNRSKLYKYAREKFIYAMKNNKEWKNKMAKSMSKLIWLKNKDTNDCLRVSEDSIEKFLAQGYELGRIIEHRNPHSAKAKKLMSDKHKGMIFSEKHKENISRSGKNTVWIFKDGENKMVKKNVVQDFLTTGWEIGRGENKEFYGKNKDRIAINKNNNVKYVKQENVKEFIDDGWLIGSGRKGIKIFNDKHLKKISKRTIGTIWINNSIVNKRVKKQKVKNFIKIGWMIGRVRNGKTGNNQFNRRK